MANNFVILQDDKKLFPVYQITPVVTQKALDANPGIWEALNKVASRLTNQVMSTLTNEVDGKKRDPAAVAKEFLQNQGLVARYCRQSRSRPYQRGPFAENPAPPISSSSK